MRYELNKVYHKKIITFSFGDADGVTLSVEDLIELLKDGRFCSPFMEKMVCKWFPELTNVNQKKYDHICEKGNKIEQKGFTRATGCKFIPSNMIGEGRHKDLDIVAEGIKEHNLTYCIVDIVDFPSIRIKFIDGKKLLREYPSGEIHSRFREEFFNG